MVIDTNEMNDGNGFRFCPIREMILIYNEICENGFK